MNDIDFVVLWVDSCDPTWQTGFAELKGENNHHAASVHPSRFRDMGIFNY